MTISWTRNGALLAGLALAATQVSGQQQPASTAQIRNGEIGFVISSMRPAMLADGVTQQEACPDGLSLAPAEAYAKLPADRRAALESAYQASAGARQAAVAAATAARAARPTAPAGAQSSTGSATPPISPGQPGNAPPRVGGGGMLRVDIKSGQINPDGSAVCLNPAPMGPDPSFRTVSKVVRAEGIDLDGKTSRASDRPDAESCPHDDMTGSDGVKNVDNQQARVLGCMVGYWPGGILADTYEGTMREGLWTLVVKLSKVDSLLNDPEVDVLIASSEDSLKLDSSGSPTRNLTYEAHSNPKYRSVTKGRIVNGVLTTDPVDITYVVRLASSPRASDMTQIAGRLKMTIAPNGSASGILGGYEDVERLAHVNYAVGGNAYIASAGSQLAKYTCNGIYYSMLRYADGKRDPKTGKCTAISSQWKIKAGPAFVIVPPPAASS